MSSDQGSGGFQGGQTGSLQPCSAPAFEPAPYPAPMGEPSVPTGDAAVVFHTGCSADAGFKITDANGEPVPFELLELEDGVVLLKADEALTPGTYQVGTPDGTQETVTVTDPVPLPTQLGTLSSGQMCPALFQLTFAPEVEPYLPLMRLEYSVDGGPRRVWFEYGTIPVPTESVLLEVEGVEVGAHRVEVFALIAGEDMGPEPLSNSFASTDCGSGDEGDGTFQCSVRRGAGVASAGSGTALALLGIALVWTRRRRPPLTRRR